MSISFRKADQEDIYFLLALRKQTMDEHLLAAGLEISEAYHLSRIKEFYQDSNIILSNDQVIGLLKLSVLKKSVHVRQIQILPEFQNRGIGAKVVELVKQRAEKLNLPVTLNVLLKNPAKHLYTRQGFKVVGQNDLEYQLKWVGQPSQPTASEN
ncbi:GNAT family N-acetyltransferase [Thalassotalea sp. PLHSN55]|uniref:GNAT family N-acetyltransferase n=1 Tax=Thalassotalea sp. PLHSN55 TaxID=3435888 RepID=UPI003F868BCC